MTTSTADRFTRRDLLVRAGAGVSGLAAIAGRPPPAAADTDTHGRFRGTLHVLGMGIDEYESIRRQAEKDLGFTLAFEVTEGDAAVERAITQPASFDVLSYYHFAYDVIWPSGGLQPVDTRRVTRWPQVSDLFKRGKLRPGDRRCTYGQGDAPFRCMYVDDSGRYPVSRDVLPPAKTIVQWIDEHTGKPYRGLPEPRYVDGVPTYFNMDGIGYNRRILKRPPEAVSWGELFNPAWRGRVALFGTPQIGLQDAGNAAEALGLMRFKDKGDMTRAEIDGLVKILIRLKKRRQFRGFWEDPDQATAFMHSGDVVVESMWALSVMQLQAKGFPVAYAAPPEGYRGWSGALSISGALRDPARLQAAYDYINWWHDGYPGAVMMRVGYYSAVQATSRAFVEPAEWAYWIEGKPAAKNLPGPFGDVTIRRGQVREGGSLERRARKFASWNSIFREHAYQEKRWYEFRTA